MFETLGMIRQGGICMLPLAGCSLIAGTVIVERCLALRRHLVIEPYMMSLVRDYAGEKQAEQVMASCRRSGRPLARVLEEVVQTRHLEHAQAVEAINATGRSQVASLERGLTVLDIIGGISPLLGLLGTVLGMVDVFSAITASGIGNPQVLSDGISKALITTVAGLFIAIPAVGFHSWFSRRVDEFATEIQNISMQFSFRVRAAQVTAAPKPRASASAE